MTSQFICQLDDILPETGICALYHNQQIAVFRTKNDQLFAIDNFDPFSQANVLSRGLIGSSFFENNRVENNGNGNGNDVKPNNFNADDFNEDDLDKKDALNTEVLYVASPIYKQRFNLATGECLDDQNVRINSYNVRLDDNRAIYISNNPN